MSRQTWTPGVSGDNATAIKAVIDDNYTELYGDLKKSPFAYTAFDFAPDEQFNPVGSSQQIRENLRLASASKKGCVSVRADNPVIADTEGALMPLIAIFEKYNSRILIAENLEQNIIRTNELYKLPDYLKIQRGGHELADTTPSNSCDYFKIPPGYESLFTPYVGSGITEIVSDSPYDIAVLEREYLKSLASQKIGADNAYTINVGTNRIDGDFSSVSGINHYLHIDNLTGDKVGWQPLLSIAAGEATIQTVYGGTISFDATENISMYVSDIGITDCILTEAATYLLFLVGQCWFHYMGLEKNNCWVHPGGVWARIKNEYATSAMQALGMTFSDTYDTVKQILTYNYERTTPYTAHTWGVAGGELNVDDIFATGDQSSTKNYIADAVARNWHITVNTHFYIAQMPGATDVDKIQNYYTQWELFLKWAFEADISFITYSEMRYLTIDAKTDQFINVIPNLYTDIATQSKPDGYTLGGSATWESGDGVDEDKDYSIKLNGNGTLATITDLGGLEKGLNDFNIYLKGAVGAILAVQFGAIGTATFTIADAGWNRLNISAASGLSDLTIPLATNFLDITFTASNNIYSLVLNISNCENSVAGPYDTFANATPTGFDAIKSGAGTQYAGTADEIVFVSGTSYLVTFILTLNSGQAPQYDLEGALGSSSRTVEGLQLSSAGANSFTFESNYNGTGVCSFRNSNVSNYEITNLEVKEVEGNNMQISGIELKKK